MVWATTTTASGIGSKKRLGIENRLREFQIVCILIERERGMFSNCIEGVCERESDIDDRY